MSLHAPLLQHMSLGQSLGDVILDETLALSGPSNFPLLRALCLTLGKFGVSAEPNLQILSRAFPFLLEIVFLEQPLCRHPPPVHELLPLIERNRISQNGVGVWPRLETLGLCLPDRNIPAPELQSFLVKREEMGFPIKKLLLQYHIAEGLEIAARAQQPGILVAEYCVQHFAPFEEIFD